MVAEDRDHDEVEVTNLSRVRHELDGRVPATSPLGLRELTLLSFLTDPIDDLNGSFGSHRADLSAIWQAYFR